MLKYLFYIVIGMATFSPFALAQLQDIKITAARKKLDQSVQKGYSTTAVTKEIVYVITVQNKTFQNMTDVSVKYMLFYEDTERGSKDDGTIKSVKGSETVAIEAHRSFSFDTKSIKLTKEELDGGWYYANGSSARNKDRVKGVWVQAYIGGILVGEYANPTTVPKKYAWKE